jgi:hypothetical protein
VIRSSFRSAGASIILAAGFVVFAATCGEVHMKAQSPPLQARVLIDSGVEAAGAAGPSLSGTRLAAELSHQRRGRRGTLRFWTGGTADQWWQGDVPRSLAGAGDVAGDLTLTRRMRLDFSNRVSYAPLDLFGTLGAGAAVGAPPPVLSGAELPFGRTLSNNAMVSLSRTIGMRSHLSLSATQALSINNRDRVSNSGASALFARQLGRFTGWHASYGTAFSTSRLDDLAAGRQHNADAGLDYARPLPFAPRTTVTFTGGAGFLADASGRRVRVNVQAGMARHLVGRWSMSADYSRPVEYIPGVAQPLVTDSVRLGAAGLLPRRIAFSIEGGASSGAVGVVGGSPFVSYVVAAHVSRRLGREWSVDLALHDSRYRFDVSPGVGIPAAFARRGVRAGLVWAPGSSSASGQ